jgi:hypothetical protein
VRSTSVVRASAKKEEMTMPDATTATSQMATVRHGRWLQLRARERGDSRMAFLSPSEPVSVRT